MSFTSIPILDMALANDQSTKPAFLSDLRHALLEVGFLYLKNVGIPDSLFQEVIKEGKAFFDIPLEEKYFPSFAFSSFLLPKPRYSPSWSQTQNRNEKRSLLPRLLPPLGRSDSRRRRPPRANRPIDRAPRPLALGAPTPQPPSTQPMALFPISPQFPSRLHGIHDPHGRSIHVLHRPDRRSHRS